MKERITITEKQSNPTQDIHTKLATTRRKACPSDNRIQTQK